MKKSVKLLMITLGLGACLLAKARSISIYPFTLDFPPVQFDYARDGFVFSPLATVSHTLPNRLSVEQEISVKAFRDLLNVNGVSLYPTDVAGIGVALKIRNQAVTAEKNSTQYLGSSNQGITVLGELVAYDKVASGVYQIPQLYVAGIQFGQDPNLMPIIVQPTTITVKQKSCEISTALNQNVKLQPVFASDLARQKSVLGGNFTLGLQCDENVRADVVFFDQNDVSSHAEWLSLDHNSSTAKGVGIAIDRQDGSRVRLGEKWTFSLNQRNPTQQFSAKYVATGEPISAGSVKAVATVSFTYH